MKGREGGRRVRDGGEGYKLQNLAEVVTEPGVHAVAAGSVQHGHLVWHCHLFSFLWLVGWYGRERDWRAVLS